MKHSAHKFKHMTKEYVKERYDLLFELYGVQSRGWSMLHEQISYREYAVIKPYLIKEGE